VVMDTSALFFDRDGILNEMVYDSNHGIFDSPLIPEQVKIKNGAVELVRGAKALGYKIIIVTNQPGIAKGTLTFSNLEKINKKIIESIGKDFIDDLIICPHHPKGLLDIDSEYITECDCRKPKPGMIIQAASKHRINLSNSWMIGDGITDIQAGKSAGCKTMLIANIKIEHLQKFNEFEIFPDLIVPTLFEALLRIKKIAFI
jgi:D-glycero-D-manno-heptose 1,7-bisphosphate phosphatase